MGKLAWGFVGVLYAYSIRIVLFLGVVEVVESVLFIKLLSTVLPVLVVVVYILML